MPYKISTATKYLPQNKTVSKKFLVDSIPFLICFLCKERNSIPFLLIITVAKIGSIMVVFRILQSTILKMVCSKLLTILLHLPFLLNVTSLT